MAWKDLLVRVGMDSRGFAKGASDLKRDTQGMKNSIAQLATEMRKQRDQLKQLGQDGKGASNEYRRLKASISENNGAFRAMQRELRAVEVAQGKVRTSTGGLLSSFKGVGGALTGGLIGGGVAGAAIMGIGALKAGISDTLNVAVDFDDQMRKVAATSGATGRQFEMLKGAAISMGSATRFTATQAGEALNFMALAGWNTEQAISGLPGVLNLAAAAGTDLGLTSDILTDTMAAFGMSARESTHAADIFAQVQSKANTTVEQLGEAMKYAGPNAAAANQSLESTATILGLMANQGVKGTMAGTALNSMFRDMKKNADDGVISFGKMNIKLYDQQGRFRDILDIVAEMREGVKGMTTEQRDAITGGLFDERAIKGVNILLNSTDDTINGLTQSLLNATGRSKEMADMMEGGVGGALRGMKSAWEGLQLTVSGDGGIAESWYNYWKTKFLQWTVEVSALQTLWKKFTGELEKPVKMERAINIGNIFDDQKTRPQRPIGVFAPIKGKTKIDDDDKEDPTPKIKTAASAYRDLQKELQTTREYLNFVGEENEYIGEAIKKVQSGMESIFKMGGKDALQYSALLQEELKVLKAQADRAQMPGPVAQIGMISPKGKFEMPKGMESQVQVMGKMALEMQRITSRAAAFGSEYDKLGAQITSVSSMISQAINGEIEMSASAYQGLIDKLNELKLLRGEELEAEYKRQDQMQKTMQMTQAASQISGALFESMAAGSMEAGQALQGLALSALDAAQSMIMANLAAGSSAIAKWAANLGPAGPIVAAAGIAALFGMVKGAIGKSKGVKLAKGGLAYGETMATVGDNPGARFDPEVVAPLSKLQGMLETKQGLYGDFRIRGEDLVLAIDNQKRKSKAFGR